MKRPPIIRAFLGDEAIVDSFAGGGGASLGIELGLGRSPDIAVNHDAEAIAMHRANHPETRHYIESVWEVDPRTACAGRGVALAWFSPDCKHHSKAKGGKPRDQKIRGLAWVAVTWAARVAPRVIVIENVEEFRDWGPLHRTGELAGKPIAARKGETFRAFVGKLERLGYVVEHRLLRACDYGAPTTRRRMFLIARRDGVAIRWPVASHGTSAIPHRTAAECIDWSIPCPSIFDRDRPLADKTMARIARGIRKFVLEAKRPFVIVAGDIMSNNTNNVPHGVDEPVPTVTTGNRNFLVTPLVAKAKTHGGGGNDARRADAPLGTVTASKRGEFAVVAPVLVPQTHGDSKGTPDGRVHRVDEPMRTITTLGAQFHVAVPYLVHRSNGERVGQDPRTYSAEEPLRTVVAQGEKFAVCAAFLAKHYGGNESTTGGSSLDRAIDTVTAQDHHSLVAASLVRYNGDVPGRERVGQIDLPLGTQDTARRYGLAAASLIKFYGTSTGSAADEPAPTITAGGWKLGAVAAFLARYNGTSTGQQPDAPLGTVDTTDRYALVTVTIDGEPYVIVDIGMRMLTPRELFRAQGFSDEYQIAPEHNGKPLTKTAQIRMCGNSVCPPVAAAIVRAQFPEAA